ncbi:Crp/Fnr family transcriptional regulator [Puia sp.]|uniref:Crp/Fnr family transcriptional regulator n=1 Tax=Puia sp. TaxID=2045100 RepID=UPI002F3F26E8
MSNSASSYKAALEDLYRYFARFTPLSKQEFNQFLPYIEIREFEKKAIVINTGEVERYLNVIAWGLARKYLPVRNREITVQLASEGHIVHADLSFHYRIPSSCVIETIEPTVFFSITYENLQEAYDLFPKAERLGRLLLSDLFVKKDSRYFDQLRKNTRERFLDYVRTHPQMLQRVPQKYIASYLNIKPETFSRLKHLMRSGRKAL